MTDTPWFGASDEPAFADFASACERHAREIRDHVSRIVDEHPVIGPLFVEAARVPTVVDAALARLRQGISGDWKPQEEILTDAGKALARVQVPMRTWAELGAEIASSLVPMLVEEYGADPRRLSESLQLAQRLFAKSFAVVGDAQHDAQADMRRRTATGEHPSRLGEKPLARLFESGLIGILICDLVGNIKEANDSFLDMVGYSRDELLSGAVRWAEMTPPEFRALDDDAIEQLKARGVTRPWEKEYIRKDGTRLPIVVGVAMLSDVECIAFVLDISERRRLEELRLRSAELETQNRRIQESNRLKGEFLANMSHELRTPLNSIIGFTELLHQGEIAPDSPHHKEFLGDILSSGRHLLQLINDVLDLAKVEAGKFEFYAQDVSLSNLVTEVGAVVRSMAASKRIRTEIDVDRAVDHVTLDPARLKQVLYNYISNALKFTNEGGRVWIRARPEGPDMFRLEVEDTGVGIAPSDLGRLFVEFQQLDAGATKKHSGTGLGLALTKRLVEAQGGSVGVRSTPGAGSVFFATLPMRVDSVVIGDENQTTYAAADSSASILVVEDDARDRALLVQTLHKAGYGVETASTGTQAISSTAQKRFDAITLDLLLPDITGLDVLHRIRGDGKNRQTPVVVVSVVADKGMVGGFAVHDYLTKPINGVELLSSLRRGGVLPDEDASILVVDDDPAALKLMEATLKTIGHRVISCASGVQALARLREKRPGAVVLDLLMPEMDGFEFLTQFRLDPANHQIPVIVWTMKDLTAKDHRFLSDSAQAVVTKQGGGTGALLDELRSLLSRRLRIRRVAL